MFTFSRNYTVRGKKKAKQGADALCPRPFIVRSAGDVLVVQIDVRAPAVRFQTPFQEVSIGKSASALCIADIEPDSGSMIQSNFIDITDDALVIPPYGRRKHGEPTEDVRILQSQIESYQAAK